MSDCYKCGYKGRNPGSAHIRCKYNWRKSELSMPEGDSHGIKHNWWIFPINFDPVWMIDDCLAFATECQTEMVIEKYDSLSEVMAIFASVGR